MRFIHVFLSLMFITIIGGGLLGMTIYFGIEYNNVMEELDRLEEQYIKLNNLAKTSTCNNLDSFVTDCRVIGLGSNFCMERYFYVRESLECQLE